jgi:NAD(P)-dependent dehydrogenase (short-subunit alcohol dehydrogenase family)
MNTLSAHPINHILLLGASGGIGSAIVKQLQTDYPLAQIDCLMRDPSRLLVEGARVLEINDFSEEQMQLALTNSPSYQLIINCIGQLETQLGGPEKSVRDLDEEKLLLNFKVNSLITPLLAKILRPKLQGPYVFATLSAMVGSIGENDLGGWYGYRASKAALNMFIKNLAIEFGRTNKQSLFLAIHPGTTQTKLSEKFNTRVNHKIHTPQEAASYILEIIFQTPFDKTGSFLSWDKRVIAW